MVGVQTSVNTDSRCSIDTGAIVAGIVSLRVIAEAPSAPTRVAAGETAVRHGL